jgi:hypothetical protein
MGRCILRIATFIAFASSVAFSQLTPNDPGAAASPGNMPAAQNPAQPASQMPPDTKAPAPSPSQKQEQSANGQNALPARSSSEPTYLPSGTMIRAALDTPLSTKTARPGDRFTATISAPVRDSLGNLAVPIGSKLNGQVTEATDQKLESAIRDMGHLDLRFTDIQLPNGADIPIDAKLISIHNAKGGKLPGASHNSANAAPSGFPGAFGPPLKGLAVGNLNGGGYVLATSSKQVELPASCGLVLRIERNSPLP